MKAKKIMEPKKGRLCKEMEDPFYLKDPNIKELYEKCFPPKEAYYYFPKGEDLIEFNAKKPQKSYRKIYHDVPFLDLEKKYIADYKVLINKHPEVKIPSYIEDALFLRFIYADECDMEVSFKRLVKYLELINKTFPIVMKPQSKLKEILNKGFVYAYGRDCRFRPILVFRVKEFVKNQNIYSVEEVVEAGLFLGQFILNHMMIPGKIERWNLIIYLKGATVFSLPEHVKKLIPIMNEAFISRLNKNYVIGMTFILRVLYKVVCAFLHESTIRKIKILGGKKDQSLFEEIRRDNIEEDFGGTAPNVKFGEENSLFPPRMPSDKFLLENERPDNILISEEEYIKKYNNGEIDDDYASPYISEKLNKNNNNNNTIKSDKSEKPEVIEQPQLINNQKYNPIPDASPRNTNKPRVKIPDKDKEKQAESEEDKLKKMKEEKIKKVKTFLYHGWDFHQEYNNTNEEKYNNKTFQTFHRNKIIDDIYSLSNKKNNFCKKISIISNTNNNDNTKKIYSLNS